MNQPNPYSPPASRVADVESHETSPLLWNPRAAANWSLIFTPAFGAFVQMKNWQALGEHGRAATSKGWAVGTIVFFVVLTVLGLVVPESKLVAGLTQPLAIVLLVVWYYANGKPQYAYVVARYGKTYRKRGWGKPLLFAVAALLGFLLVMVVLGVGFALLTRAT